MKKIHIVGAGPGDPKLITVKGMEMLQQAEIVIYAGSLVNPDLLQYCSDDTEIHNSAYMTLDEVLDVIVKGVEENKKVVRLHTGDPSMYGAIQEQIVPLNEKGIEVEIIPGVSSVFGAAAALNLEYTLPDVSQTLILTRMEGRTPVPEKEKLHMLAQHQTTMAIFLSVGMIQDVVDELLKGGYREDTPIAVVQRATWPDQKEVVGTLQDIAPKVEAANITKTALIIVGDVLKKEYTLSKLYDPTFSTEYRAAKE